VDTFIKFDGVDGESTHKDHKGEIEVLSWNWGITNASTSSAGGGGVGKARLHELRVVHQYDAASPVLAANAATGRHITEASLSVSRGGEKATGFLKVSMKDVLVTEVDVAGGGEAVIETVALRPAWIRFDYARQSPSGAAGGTTSFTWDRASGTKLG